MVRKAGVVKSMGVEHDMCSTIPRTPITSETCSGEVSGRGSCNLPGPPIAPTPHPLLPHMPFTLPTPAPATHQPPGTARSSDFTDPLEPWESPRRSLCSVLAWLPSQLAPFLPPGMRHAAQPHAGAMAR